MKEKYVLTTCQYKALNAIIDWYRNTDAISYSISGAAGTGKTFLIRMLLEKFKKDKVIISAPTHKALIVAQGFTGIIGETPHKLLGLLPNFELSNFDIRSPSFVVKNVPTIGNYDLIILDEASMVQDSLADYIIEEATLKNTRLLFMGDHLQLPPVNNKDEKISKLFDKSKFHSILLKPVRQSLENPLYLLLCALRADIEHEGNYEVLVEVAQSFNEQIIIDIVNNNKNKGAFFITILKAASIFTDGEKGYHAYTDNKEFTDIVSSGFKSKEFSENSNYCKFIAYTNDTVSRWNTFIRELTINSTNTIEINDLLMAYKTVYDNDMKVVIRNGEEYMVKSVFNDMANVTVHENGILTEHTIPYIYARIKSIYNNSSIESGISILSPPYDDFLAVHKIYHNAGVKQKKWRQYYQFKNCYFIHGNMKVGNTVLPKKDIDYAYGLTVHKAQGSTFDNVFINLDDILTHLQTSIHYCKQQRNYTPEMQKVLTSNTLRLIYVALGRAKNKAHIFYSRLY